MVISDGNLLSRCLIKKVSATKQGPILSATITKDTMKLMVDGLSIDNIIASWPLNNEAWLIPVGAITGMQSVRLSNRDDWLIAPIRRLDAPTRIDIDPAIAKQIKEQGKAERTTIEEADNERDYFNDILKGDSNVSNKTNKK